MTTLRESALCEVEDRVLSLVIAGEKTVGWKELNLSFSDGEDLLTLFFCGEDEYNPQGIKPLLKLAEVFENFLQKLNEKTSKVQCGREFLSDDSFTFAGYTFEGLLENDIPIGFFVLYDNDRTIVWKVSSRMCENIEQESFRRKEFFQKVLVLLKKGQDYLTTDETL